MGSTGATAEVRTYVKRDGTVVSGHSRRNGRPIEWEGLTLGEPDDPENTPQGSLVAWITEHDEDGTCLSVDEGGVCGVIHAKRTTVSSVFKQYMSYWKRNIRWGIKHGHGHSGTDARGLLLTIQKVEGDNCLDVPGKAWEAGIGWVEEDGVLMPKIMWSRKWHPPTE